MKCGMAWVFLVEFPCAFCALLARETRVGCVVIPWAAAAVQSVYCKGTYPAVWGCHFQKDALQRLDEVEEASCRGSTVETYE